VPTNTFVATANAVIYAGGTPVLADIKATTLCLDPAEILKRITSRTKGVVVVHLAGFPCPEIDEIGNICREHGLFLMEDVAHAHGATIDGRKTGSLSQAGCFSFYPTKVMTTCTGGMLTTNDDKLAEYARSVRHHGVGAGLHDIVNLGNDWLMDEISAVLGTYQLQSLEANIARRNNIARLYRSNLTGIPGLMTFNVPDNIRHVYYKYPVYLSSAVDTDRLTSIMKNNYSISLGSVYDPPCHLQPVYQKLYGFHKGGFPVADAVLENVRCLPIYPQMTDNELDHVISSIKTVLPQCIKETMTV
jgi:dTDP-4-amino-4,6-dideoxygalactose transaminase